MHEPKNPVRRDIGYNPFEKFEGDKLAKAYARIIAANCMRDNTCFFCDNNACLHTGNIKADCTSLNCMRADKDCFECEYNNNYGKISYRNV